MISSNILTPWTGSRAQGYRMIETLEIENFRCFDKLSLEGFKRINLIVGKNASGKTAFLESLFLTSGDSPQIVLRTRSWRGLPQFGMASQRTPYEHIWRDLFFRFDQKRDISISFTGSVLDTRSLKASYRSGQNVLIPFQTSEGVVDTSPIIPIIFEWTDGAGKKSSCSPSVTEVGLTFKPEGEAAIMPAAFYSSSNLQPAAEAAAYFSAFKIKNKQETIVECMKKEFPFIKEISTESGLQGSLVYVLIDGIEERVPINFVSSGVSKLLSLVLGIAHQPGGVIYIDEIENGFYYDRLPSIWRLLLQFCKKYDVQIFASTHSRECLEAAAACAKENEDDFCLLRIENEDGKSSIRQFTGKTFQSAIGQDREIR